MPDDALQKIREAIDGLLYPSEADEPFELLPWKPQGDFSIEKAVDQWASPHATLEKVPIDQFFDQLKDADDADRFSHLRELLQSMMTETQVIRANDDSAEVLIFIIAKLASGAGVVLRTKSIET